MTFKKNNNPWNKGKKTGIIPKTSFKKGFTPWNKGIKGKIKLTEEHKNKISNSLKNRSFSDEHRMNLSKQRIGIKLSDYTKNKISNSKKGKVPWSKGKSLDFITRIKISESKKGKKYPKEKYPNSGWRNKHLSEETKKKLRIATINHIKNVCGGISPMIGKNEEMILNELEKLFDEKIIRQYEVEGYFLDGYIKRLNLVIEVDEKPKDKERDKKRQNIIETKLNCKFLRIEDKF